MKIFVGGKDRSDDVGARIRCAAERRRLGPAPSVVSPDINALCLLRVSSENAYLREFLRILPYRDAFDAADVKISTRSGPVGWALTKVKSLLWRLIRFQYERVAFRQNLINRMFTTAIQAEVDSRERDLKELRFRIEALESR